MSSGHKRPRHKSTAAEVREAQREQSRLARLHRPIPVSLGKPSLRRRLEAYYSLIAPDVVEANEAEWVRKFDLIYEKFGGSVAGERKLSSKLAKKYGDAVRLLTVDDEDDATSSAATTSNTSSTITTGRDGNDPSRDEVKTTTSVRPEEWFELTPEERGSGITDFASPRFDPVAALTDPLRPPVWCASDAPLLDNISKARRLLPPFDPQRLVVPAARPVAGKKEGGTGQRPQQLPALDALASRFEDAGPLSVLSRCHCGRRRVRVMIRYVDGIRGTLTGSLLGFDKHANMILRDVDEVYSPRRRKVNVVARSGSMQKEEESNEDDRSCWEPTSAEMEVQRRLNARLLRRRHMKQLLVRGDNVVMVWKADEERPSSTGVVRTPGSLLAPP